MFYNTFCTAICIGAFLCSRRLCVDHDDVRPDMVLLGKALSGGLYPVWLFSHLMRGCGIGGVSLLGSDTVDNRQPTRRIWILSLTSDVNISDKCKELMLLALSPWIPEKGLTLYLLQVCSWPVPNGCRCLGQNLSPYSTSTVHGSFHAYSSTWKS